MLLIKKENIVMYKGVTVDGVWIGELDLLTPYTHHLKLQAISNLRTSQITTAPAKPFPSLLSSPVVSWQQI
jgi:hypothetical protein